MTIIICIFFTIMVISHFTNERPSLCRSTLVCACAHGSSKRAGAVSAHSARKQSAANKEVTNNTV